MAGANPGLATLGGPLGNDCGDGVFDVLVVGGGITGAGVARHAAQCGLKTLLLEAADFAAGTSSRSTKLIHGGLRYLAMGDFALVRESALERKSLLAMAPHLTEPRWMLVPAASRLEYAKLRVGISLYEWLGAVGRQERHRNWGRAEIAAGEPLLRRDRLPWACAYREYLTDDARLVLATLRAAVADGAIAHNYARVIAVRSGSEACVVTVRDEVTGSEHDVRARCVVNAAGPWVETLLPGEDAGAGSPPSPPPRLHLSKGVHLVLARDRLPVHNIVMMTAADGRPVFAIPRGAVTYVGTTDTTHVGGPEHWPDVTAADIDYLMGVVNAHFDVPQVTARDILATWAGLRPLIHQAGKAPKEMSRRDEIWRNGHLITVAGGKLTGFRKMAEEAMAAVGEVLGCDVTMPRPLEPLAGGAVDDVGALARQLAARYQVADGVAVRLARLYGSEAVAVLGDDPRPLSPSVFAEEVMWAIRVEGARTLEDVIYRRLRTAWFLPGETRSLVPATADLLAAELGLAHADIASQSVDIQRRLDDELVFHRVAEG